MGFGILGFWVLNLKHRFDRRKDRLWLHHHTAAAAVGGIVGNVVLVRRIVADVVGSYSEQARCLRPLEDALLQVAIEHSGEEGEEVNMHKEILA